jgi:Skp family chaperone for outer membrane proteins
MRTAERVTLYAAVGAALLLSLNATLPTTGAAQAAGAAADAPQPRLAVCALYKIADELMDTERFKPARVEFETQLREESLKPLIDQLKELQQRLESMDQKDPAFAETRERFFRTQNLAQRTTQEIAQKIERKVAEQLKECYGLARTSAVAVAEDMGFNYVIASNAPDDDLESETVVSLVRDMLSRPVLLNPKEVDISEDVRQDLKLE